MAGVRSDLDRQPGRCGKLVAAARPAAGERALVVGEPVAGSQLAAALDCVLSAPELEAGGLRVALP